MKFVQAQFSLKFEPQLKIRRYVNDMEDYLCKYYGIPQTIPLPDDYELDAPRVILYSKNGHSQISFSLISVDFVVNFDDEFMNDFLKTKEYIQERVTLIASLLEKIGIKEYLFCGITYNAHLDIREQRPIDYIKKFLNNSISYEGLYEASQNVACVKDDKFFINQQIGTYKEFQGKLDNVSNIPNLFKITNDKMISEGISLSLDINNRYQYVYKNKKNLIDNCLSDVDKIFLLLSENIYRWEK